MGKVFIVGFIVILGIGVIYGVYQLLFLRMVPFTVISPQQQNRSHSSLLSSASPTPSARAPIRLEQIFDRKVEEILENARIVLLATGDVIPARSVNYQATLRNDFLWPYRGIAPIVSDADITFINLETPLLRLCPLTQEGMVFCGSNRHVEGLRLLGVDVASVANNHSGNHGRTGLDETIHLLESNNIRVTGDVDPVILMVKGVRFGFLGFNDISGGISGMQQADEENIKARIGEIRGKVDVVVVTFHWGEEYKSQPDGRQKYLGHLTIDSGADLVVANHPHWVQPVEIYKGKVIMYAHGNTIFDQEWSEETKRGVLGKYIFEGKNLVDIEFVPIGLKNYGEAFVAEGLLRDSILANLQKQSEILQDSSLP